MHKYNPHEFASNFRSSNWHCNALLASASWVDHCIISFLVDYTYYQYEEERTWFCKIFLQNKKIREWSIMASWVSNNCHCNGDRVQKKQMCWIRFYNRTSFHKCYFWQMNDGNVANIGSDRCHTLSMSFGTSLLSDTFQLNRKRRNALTLCMCLNSCTCFATTKKTKHQRLYIWFM